MPEERQSLEEEKDCVADDWPTNGMHIELDKHFEFCCRCV